MGTPDLTGLVAKVCRADETLAVLESEVDEFLATHCRIEGRVLADERRYAFFAYGASSLQPRFAVLVGEVVHHLRSTLDHLIAQLAAVGPGGGDPNVLEFPICRTPYAFSSCCKRGKVTGLTPSAIQIIEGLQPYKTEPPENSTLLALHDLDRIDKHRLLIVVVATVMMADQLTLHPSQPVDIVGMSPPVPPGTRPSSQGTRIFSVDFGESFDQGIHIESNFGFRVAFEQLGLVKDPPVLTTLKKMRAWVANCISRFFPGAV